MKRALFILVWGAVAAYGNDGKNGNQATLRWTNGEVMSGDLVEASGSTASWKTPLFEEPLVIGWNAVHRVDWPAAEAQRANDPFIIALRDGSSIYGDLVSITGSSIFIHAGRYGDVELKRAEVLGVRRIKGGALLLAGPTGDVGWEAMGNRVRGYAPAEDAGNHNKQKVPAIAVGEGGALEMPYWNRTASLDLQLPDAVDVEFHLHASGRPDFRFSIAQRSGSVIRIETWDDEVVIAVANDFRLVRKIAKTEHDVALRFCWDSNTRHCSVFTPAGELIADWQAPEDHSLANPGVALQNKGRDLSLDFLRIRTWSGSLPPKIDLSRPRIELDDGRIFAGEIASGTAGSIRMRGQGDSRPGQSFAVKDIDALVFSPDSPQADQARPAAATLTYTDGTYLQGQLSVIKDGGATLDTSFTAQPLAARMDALGQLLIHTPAPPGAPPEPPLSKLDRLVIEKNTLYGTFVTAGDESPRWLPAGATVPVMPSKTIPYEIKRSMPDDQPIAAAPALFYTRAGDVLPGTLRSLDRSGAEFAPAITETGTLAAAQLEAIQFGGSGRMNLHGFTEAGWHVLSGSESKIVRKDNALEMEPGTSIGHPGAMQSSEIRFDVGTESFFAVRLRMFCAGTDPARSTNLLVMPGINGGITCGIEAGNDQIDEPRVQVGVPSGDAVAVRLVIQENEVELYLNGTRMQTYPIPSAGRAGAGLIVEPASVWGNSPHPIKLADFSTVSAPGSVWMPDVAADAKSEALTVPRFRRDDPPVHALIATNGDILRGEIEAATKANFGFRNGLDELVVSRDRVKAVIWLGKPQEAPSPAAKNPARALLDQKLDGRIGSYVANLPNFPSFLQRQLPDLKFKIPENVGTQNFELRIGNATVWELLDRICSHYGLTYRLDEQGVIVIEERSEGPDAMVEKLYWLKPGSFPANDPADKILAALSAKGVPFPPGATAEWNADSSELAMQNTPENQAKLTQLLASDFGGSIGSPTHWLLLASGARLALAVDKFDKDVITGRHPIYGRCTIPTADVVDLRTYPLEASPVMKAVDDWRLVYAPEPVLPEAGGESAALIGKAAPDFKLDLLAGGQFELAQEKGKIVVLDFWATWCGPCVRSLPELIPAMAGFSPDRVRLVGINEDEPAAEVKQFLETRGWNLAVAMDDGRHVGQQYGADAIPHTVIIGPDGKVAWVKTGYTPEGEAEVAKEVKQLLGAPAHP